MKTELFDIDNTRDTDDSVTCSCSALYLHHANVIVCYIMMIVWQ